MEALVRSDVERVNSRWVWICLQEALYYLGGWQKLCRWTERVGFFLKRRGAN